MSNALKEVHLTNSLGTRLTLINLGARVTEFLVLNRDGKAVNITLGFSDFDLYVNRQDPYFGCMVGRVANRIANAEFSLNGKQYTLNKNNGDHSLHGGPGGWSYVLWNIKSKTPSSVTFEYVSPDGEEGFPGEVKAEVIYSLSEDNRLTLEMRGVPSEATPINMTNHMYFNLNGAGVGDVLDHELRVFADRYIPVDAGLIPTGEILEVIKTPFDFRGVKKIGQDLGSVPGGYDHTFVINDWDAKTLHPACVLSSAASGIQLKISTSQPGIQIYSGNFLDGSQSSKDGSYRKHGGVALEPHHFPDSVNQAQFPSTICLPSTGYHQTIEYSVAVVSD